MENEMPWIHIKVTLGEDAEREGNLWVIYNKGKIKHLPYSTFHVRVDKDKFTGLLNAIKVLEGTVGITSISIHDDLRDRTTGN